MWEVKECVKVTESLRAAHRAASVNCEVGWVLNVCFWQCEGRGVRGTGSGGRGEVGGGLRGGSTLSSQ